MTIMLSFFMRCIPAFLLLANAGLIRAEVRGRQGVEHFVIFGVDGLSVDGVEKAKSPYLHQLMLHGAWTLRARGVMPTLSSPNWASVITGAGPEQHGVTSNGWFTNMFEIAPQCRDSEGMFPIVFNLLKEQLPKSRIAIFHDWNGFSRLVAKHVPDIMVHERGASRTIAAAIRYFERYQPTLMFIHLDNVDHAGHHLGWGSTGYYQAVEEADRYIGEFIGMLEDSSMLSRSMILVTSDHGGVGKKHGKNSLPEIEIPWILTGPGVVQDLRLNGPVNTFDTAATVAWVFGLNPPDCWVGKPVLAAFREELILRSNRSQNSAQLTNADWSHEPTSRRSGSLTKDRSDPQ